jgi:hypothetical protein
VLDDSRRRRYCLIIFAGCSSQPPPHRPMWSTFEPAVSGHGSFPTSQIHFLVVCSCDVTSAKPITNRTALWSQARRRSDRAPHVQIITLPRRYACQTSMRREPHPVRPFHCGRTTTSTLRMGRRIMADGRRSRTGRGRRYRVRARAKDSGSTEKGADTSLRAFVRALARQAARECFELELKRQPRSIQ